jgi:LytS/YehU family sensor histidine kinase
VLRSTDKALYALWALFWALMISVAVQDNWRNPYIHWWQPLLWEGSSAFVATLWLVYQRHATRHWEVHLQEPMRWFGRHAAWLPVVSVTFIMAIYGIRHAVYAFVGLTYEHPSWPTILVYESVKLLLFSALWLAIIFGLESFSRWRLERERLLALQKHLAESQLAQLKAQLQPHFLFNALNTISALMQTDVDRADRLLTQLADLLRSSLKAGARQTTTLREEIALLRLYADIMRERFTGRVTLDWRIADDVADAAIPAMLLQPLLENAFRHGVERSTQPVDIVIDARRDGPQLRIGIHNTGSSLGAQPGLGIGLRNCRERLEVLHGGAARLDLAADATGVAAVVTLPYERSAA